MEKHPERIFMVRENISSESLKSFMYLVTVEYKLYSYRWWLMAKATPCLSMNDLNRGYIIIIIIIFNIRKGQTAVTDNMQQIIMGARI